MQRTVDGATPQAHLSAELAGKLGIKAGDKVKVAQGSGSAILVAAIHAGLPANVVKVSAAHASTAGLGGMFGDITVETAEGKI
ncbi:NADH dehydrogenase subunit G [compost metagenome]